MRKLLFLAALALALTACRQDIVFSQFVSIPSGEWHVDSVAQFNYQIPDKKVGYQVLVYVRHTERYPYQNMWLFLDNAIRSSSTWQIILDNGSEISITDSLKCPFSSSKITIFRIPAGTTWRFSTACGIVYYAE